MLKFELYRTNQQAIKYRIVMSTIQFQVFYQLIALKLCLQHVLQEPVNILHLLNILSGYQNRNYLAAIVVFTMNSLFLMVQNGRLMVWTMVCIMYKLQNGNIKSFDFRQSTNFGFSSGVMKKFIIKYLFIWNVFFPLFVECCDGKIVITVPEVGNMF